MKDLSAFLVLVFLAGCSGSDDPMMMESADMSGSWRLMRSINTDTCDTGLDGTFAESIFQVSQMGCDVEVQQFDVCGNFLTAFGGTVSGTSLEIVASEVFMDPATGCNRTISEVDTGAVVNGEWAGDAVITLTADLATCGFSDTCQISGTFTASPCPPADCTFATCFTTNESIRQKLLDW